MAASAGRGTFPIGLGSRLRTLSVGAKLIFFSTALTIVAVSSAFLVLSVSVKRHTERRLAETLAKHQKTLSNLERGKLDELLRISTLMTDSPTLRAAMETFSSESSPSSDVRHDLLATIQNEANKIAVGLQRDVLIITDRNGRVLAAAGGSGNARRVGEDLSRFPIIREVLQQDDRLGARNLSVLAFDGEYVRVASAPITLSGFIIGSLTLGDRIDRGFAARLQQSFGCDVTVLAGDRVVASTVTGPIVPGEIRRLISMPQAAPDAPHVTRLAGDDYVTASLPLGSDGRDHDVSLYLLNSLSKDVGDSNRFLMGIMLVCGLSAVLVAGLAAWMTSRSVLRPLQSFVAFMRSVAATGDHSRRFESDVSCVEVDTLNVAYDHLMASLLEHEQRLIRSAIEDLDRLERLKESEKLAALGRMLSGAAHEINNPLTGVIGNVDVLLRGDRLDADTRERLETVRREGQRVAALVRHLLKISHRDTGEEVVVDVGEVLREVVEVRRHDFISAGMSLELEVPRAPIRVLGNELELHQVFLNIVNNAYDALKEGTPNPRLAIAASIAADSLCVVFTDNGPGMKNTKQVFDHFYTTKPVGQGTGLGLSIAYAVIQRHRGRIAAENGLGGGARFTIELPLAPAIDAGTRPEARRVVAAVPVEEPLDGSVLVVDDEPTLVDLQKEILEGLGAVVVGAASGREAIEQLRRRTFDVIVTDLRMPGGVSGQDLFRWVESNAPESAGRFVFVTGDNAGDGSRDFIDSIGARCVMKPFSMDDYVRTLRETFGETRRPS
jgi:signal transduction histidine kinase/CheY-like chemotaxis protein